MNYHHTQKASRAKVVYLLRATEELSDLR